MQEGGKGGSKLRLINIHEPKAGNEEFSGGMDS